MLRVLSYLKPHKKRAAVVVLLMFISTLISLVPPYFTRILIDDILKLNEGLAAVQSTAETAVVRFFRSFETAALALTVAIGCLVAAHILTHILDIFVGVWPRG